MRNLSPYENYQSSELSWVNEIPSHWDARRAKFLFNLEKRLPREDDGVVTAFRDGQVTLRSNRRTDGFTNSFKEIGYQGVRKGDLVVHAMDAFAGAIGVSDSDGKCTPVYSCLTAKSDCHIPYYAAFLRSMAVSGYIQSLAKGIRERSTDFRWREIAELMLPVPPLSEQRSIVSHLVGETARIDTLISKKSRFIELLKEKRQAVITKAVTKGLDDSVEMKDSGVEWLGKVPMHWKAVQLRRVVEAVQTGGTPSSNPPDSNFDGHPWYTPGDFSGELMLSSSEKKLNQQSILNGEAKIFPANSVLIVSIGATLGKVALAADISSANQQINAVIPTNAVYAEFLAYSLSVKTDAMRFLASSATLPIMNQEKTKEIWLAVPPKEEQMSICEYLQRETMLFDNLIGKTERSIELLKEKRSALITAAVTGKIDVREAA